MYHEDVDSILLLNSSNYPPDSRVSRLLSSLPIPRTQKQNVHSKHP